MWCGTGGGGVACLIHVFCEVNAKNSINKLMERRWVVRSIMGYHREGVRFRTISLSEVPKYVEYVSICT